LLLSFFAVDPKDTLASYFTMLLGRVPDSRDCYIYTATQGDTLEWLCGRFGVNLATVIADNKDALSSGINKLEPGTKLRLCNIPAGQRSALLQVACIPCL
jgi:phage tail protein X